MFTADAAPVNEDLADFTVFRRFLSERLIDPIFTDPICTTMMDAHACISYSKRARARARVCRHAHARTWMRPCAWVYTHVEHRLD